MRPSDGSLSFFPWILDLHGNFDIVQLAEMSELFHMVAVSHDHVVANEVGGAPQLVDINFDIGPAAASRRNRRTTDDLS